MSLMFGVVLAKTTTGKSIVRNVKQIDGNVQNETAGKNREHLSMAP